MKYSVYGPFELLRRDDGLTDTSRDGKTFFYEQLQVDHLGLPDACGCYIFVIKASQGFKPWYVGITKRQNFVKECFAPTKIKIYNEVMHSNSGIPMLFLLAKKTSGDKFAKASKTDGHKEMDFIESFFIGQALEKNEKILNIKKTANLKKMKIPGFINPNKGPQGASVNLLKNALK